MHCTPNLHPFQSLVFPLVLYHMHSEVKDYSSNRYLEYLLNTHAIFKHHNHLDLPPARRSPHYTSGLDITGEFRPLLFHLRPICNAPLRQRGSRLPPERHLVGKEKGTTDSSTPELPPKLAVSYPGS